MCIFLRQAFLCRSDDVISTTVIINDTAHAQLAVVPLLTVRCWQCSFCYVCLKSDGHSCLLCFRSLTPYLAVTI